MSQTQIVQARINGEIKAKAAESLAAMGLSVSDAIRMLLTSVARNGVMPEELFRPNETTKAAMLDAEEGRTETVTLDDLRDIIRANN